LVHVDENQVDCAAAIRAAWPRLRVILSERNLGPGGGRNQLIEAAAYPLIASFDDDSYPIDVDYFARVGALFAKFPEASLLCARLFHLNEQLEPAAMTAEWVADFVGCACVYRRERLQDTGGYVPLPLAYGMEEVDLALRLHAKGHRVLYTPWLRVFHDTDRGRHADSRVTAASIANTALLAYLRYPASLWAVGVWQCLNRVRWLVQNGRRDGIAAGLASIPSQLRKYRTHRDRVSASAVRSYLALRRRSVPLGLDLDRCQREVLALTVARQ